MIGADEHGGPSLNRLDRVWRDKHRSGATSRQPDRGGDGFSDPPLSRAIVDDSDHGCEAGRLVEDRRYDVDSRHRPAIARDDLDFGAGPYLSGVGRGEGEDGKSGG